MKASFKTKTNFKNVNGKLLKVLRVDGMPWPFTASAHYHEQLEENNVKSKVWFSRFNLDIQSSKYKL